MSFRKIKTELFISGLAFLISLATFYTLLYQTKLMRQQQYASVLPYLEIWNTQTLDSWGLMVVNKGLGPAFIEEIKITTKDTVFIGDPASFYREVIGGMDSLNIRTSNINKGILIRAGDTVYPLSIKSSKENCMKVKHNFFSRITSIEILFSSVYGEKWVTKGLGKPPVKIEN